MLLLMILMATFAAQNEITIKDFVEPQQHLVDWLMHTTMKRRYEAYGLYSQDSTETYLMNETIACRRECLQRVKHAHGGMC